MNKVLNGIFQFVVILGVGFCGGYILANLAKDKIVSLQEPNFLLLVLAAVISFILHIIIHEAGHLVFGLLTGYTFVSFRVFNVLIDKEENDKIRLRTVQGVDGTGGQCLMSPPRIKNGTFPFKLYLAGGVTFNIIFSGLVWLIAPSFYTLLFALIGIILALTNAIPMGFNDGMSMKLCLQNEVNRYAIHLSLIVNYYATQGKSYVVSYPEVLEEIKKLDVNERNYITDFLSFMEIEYYQDKFELEKVYDLLLKLYYENADLILPYKIEVMRSLIQLTSLFEPNSNLIDELLANKNVKARLKAREPQNKTILAVYEWRVKNNPQKALVILEDGRKILHRSPHLYAKIIEERYINYIESLITSEIEQKI